MICLSKADESFYQRLTWNQAPSPLAAMNTTRQDLNGISNLREHVDAGQDDGSGGTSGSLLNSHDERLSSYLKTVDGGDDQIRLHRGTLSSCASHIWSWTVWVLSVLVVSTIISSWNSPASAPAAMASTPKAHESVPLQVSPLRKRSTCETGGVNKAEYNTPLHVGALFIILCVSTLACAFPIMATKFPGLRIPTRFFFAVRHFGTGVLIATAFVHLLPTAFISLGDPCLSSFWNQDYPAMPGAIALAAIFLVTVIEMVFHPSRHVSPAEITSGTDNDAKNGNSNSGGCMGGTGMLPIRDMGPIPEMNDWRIWMKKLAKMTTTPNLEEEPRGDEPRGCTDAKLDPRAAATVFIGMALSVSIGNEFIILLIAIVFHQTFEGLALGSRIASVKWPQGKMQPWFMALAYGCTTPLGQAIGLATHTLYSPNSETGLIVVGVMNAISAGLLTFASLVELLSQDFLSDESWRFLRGRKRIYACLLVFFGAFFMSLVGAWA
ncbi:Zinc/iron permease [Fusarium oxysporum f. sp. vasinfectum]|nr:Zinc/iron permease [Fusarium oxysporum f. sp. vasinfectum]